MKFEFKQTKVPARALKRLPEELTDPRAYKVRLKPGPGYDGGVLGMVVGTDLAGKPGWKVLKNGELSGGFGTRQQAAESLV